MFSTIYCCKTEDREAYLKAHSVMISAEEKLELVKSEFSKADAQYTAIEKELVAAGVDISSARIFANYATDWMKAFNNVFMAEQNFKNAEKTYWKLYFKAYL